MGDDAMSTTLEVMPTFTNEEKRRFLSLSSLEFNSFFCAGDPRQCPERHILFKANRVLDSCHELITAEDPKGPGAGTSKDRLFKVHLHWGHVSLLAQDWSKALSCYQHAQKLGKKRFWKDPGGNYGLGMVYLHFKEYKRAAEAFERVLYSYQTLDCIGEVKVRLGVCYHNLSDYPKALKFYEQALMDVRETPFLSQAHIRFNTALAKESANDLTEAETEYKAILEEINNLAATHQNREFTPEQVKLVSAINRQLGWILYLQTYTEGPERQNRLQEAENFLITAKNYEPSNGTAFYFLGRCYGEIHNKAHEAFVNYRYAIDKSEADADTWCSIGCLYQQQQQYMDALQAFACAVELDVEHSAAWTALGRLYESHSQFEDALECFRKAVKYKPAAPEPLKARIQVLEKELHSPTPFSRNLQPPRPALPILREAWGQPIPSELRGRQDEFLKVKQQRYRDGSALFRMGELAAPLEGKQELPAVALPALDRTQLAIMHLLRQNHERINAQEKKVLDHLENIHRIRQEMTHDQFVPISVANMPQFNDSDIESLHSGGHLNLPSTIKTEDGDNEADADMRALAECVADAGQDGAVTSSVDLPATFSLEAPLNTPLDISSKELLEICSRRMERPMDFKPVFEENMPPPEAPPAPPKIDIKPTPGQPNPLLRPTPLVVVESRKDAYAPELQRFCESTTIALIRGLTAVLKMDLSLFSTKTLKEMAPEHDVEVRTQYRMPCDLNVDHLGNPSWECISTRSLTTVAKYASYQAETFQHSLKEESEKLRSQGAKYAQQAAESSSAKKRRGANGEEWAMPMKMIKFGTNVDLSDEVKWKQQLVELAKMSSFCRLIAGSNMLSHLGHTVLGMNTVQLYMKVPGSRTPAHQENNSFASVNINIGPGDCEWFGVPHEYWGQIDEMCRKRGIDFLKGSYWPNFDDLLEEGIPVYRFTQKAGDLVWVGGGCVHWVQATGWCNNIAWNVGPITHQQLTMAFASYEWNKLQGYKSLVPLQHLCWQLAKNIRFTNQNVFNLIRSQLIRSLAFCRMVSDWARSQGKQIKSQPRAKGEITHYCTLCEVEVFNILFVKEINGKFPVYCVYCTRRASLADFIVLQQIPFAEMSKIFDEFQMNFLPRTQLIV